MSDFQSLVCRHSIELLDDNNSGTQGWPRLPPDLVFGIGGGENPEMSYSQSVHNNDMAAYVIKKTTKQNPNSANSEGMLDFFPSPHREFRRRLMRI